MDGRDKPGHDESINPAFRFAHTGYKIVVKAGSNEENKMSSTNIDLIKSLYAAFGRGEIETIIGALTPDVDWVVTGRREDYPVFGSWNGQSEVRRFFQGVQEQETMDFSPREFFAADDRVFVLGHYAWRLRKTGRTVDSDWVHIFTVHNGKVVKFREFTDTAQFAAAYRG